MDRYHQRPLEPGSGGPAGLGQRPRRGERTTQTVTVFLKLKIQLEGALIGTCFFFYYGKFLSKRSKVYTNLTNIIEAQACEFLENNFSTIATNIGYIRQLAQPRLAKKGTVKGKEKYCI